MLLHFPPSRNLPRRPVLLLIRADRLDGSGMFFDFKPWLPGGIAVLLLSLAFWTPFVWGITRYLRRLTAAADRDRHRPVSDLASRRGNDELGNLGRTIESMAHGWTIWSPDKNAFSETPHTNSARRWHESGPAWEFSKSKLQGVDASALSSIEADAAELAALVNEILAFSRAGNREPSRQAGRLEHPDW